MTNNKGVREALDSLLLLNCFTTVSPAFVQAFVQLFFKYSSSDLRFVLQVLHNGTSTVLRSELALGAARLGAGRYVPRDLVRARKVEFAEGDRARKSGVGSFFSDGSAR